MNRRHSTGAGPEPANNGALEAGHREGTGLRRRSAHQQRVSFGHRRPGRAGPSE
jgi:hypothetical protein